ncbi:hypothetical protein, partial [Collimonas sp.]|uniref:hypothetical protein n=1 Tax=Collimonas sp. TaxID=1963772 RepID=UPI0037BE7068
FFIAGLSKGSLILRYLWKTKFRGKLTPGSSMRRRPQPAPDLAKAAAFLRWVSTNALADGPMGVWRLVRLETIISKWDCSWPTQ